MSGLAGVALGPLAAGAVAPPPGLVDEWIGLDAIGAPGELATVAARSAVVWLPAWSRLALSDWDAIGCWLTAGRSTVARVRLEAVGADAAVPVGTALALSRPGAAVLRAGVPTASPGTRWETLPRPWTIAPPNALSHHLRGVNRQTSAAVRLSAEGARSPRLRDLIAPCAALPARLVRGRGPWRRRLPPLVVESYRAVLLAAKTWERDSVRPVVRP